MARRRLAPLPAPASGAPPVAGSVPRAEHTAAHAGAAAPFGGPAPIARVAGEAAAAAAFDELAETLRAAREGGRLVLDLPLDEVEADHLLRDRIPAEDDEFAALAESIRARGQRTPVEVTPLPEPRRGRAYGLISGWRRLAALRALHAETGEARFATVRALVTRPESAGDAYVAMVEENEIRVGLSYYERARIAALAAETGVFPDEGAALRALFATASRPKRSRIKAFVEIVRALDGALRFPQALPERLGLKLVEMVRAGEGDLIANAIRRDDPQTPEAELALLARLVAPEPAKHLPKAGAEILPGVALAAKRRGQTLTLTLKGRGVTPELEAEIRSLLLGLRRRKG
jgi:ParB family transcriptional regulator, chromosome partitioning protein